jgi:hypothetical protein
VKLLPPPEHKQFRSPVMTRVSPVVDHGTTLGVFLDVGDLRVFIPANCTSRPSRVYRPGETVTVDVLRWFAKREGLIT